ncbi:hypothetical protein [Octadecabacter ascidiaceicola]|uniref:Uncharacterized protein n=1 Tax=Octadecabacter ascidiaceicola TaxID=1655543 RepID=A0A238K5G9_9RHOB|nr:hypothetical protein [Octadecabacter ascidiaceicola]SMX38075.1 hypothetical protein OCA8868_01667 [Octadecabacter ascidiaceicola]
MANVLPRLRHAALLAFITALWCWLLTALHGMWSFGVVLDYLNDGRMPLYPSLPVTYGTFFIYTITAPIVVFLLAFVACAALPPTYHLAAIMLAWTIGGFLGATGLAFEFQFDFGATWVGIEAFSALFFHPIMTPFWIIFGLAGTASFTRPLRQST